MTKALVIRTFQRFDVAAVRTSSTWRFIKVHHIGRVCIMKRSTHSPVALCALLYRSGDSRLAIPLNLGPAYWQNRIWGQCVHPLAAIVIVAFQFAQAKDLTVAVAGSRAVNCIHAENHYFVSTDRTTSKQGDGINSQC